MLKHFRLTVGKDKAYSRLKSLSVRFLPVSIGTPIAVLSFNEK
jgi:hypothetical protein